jgi:hypothetical protein
MVRARSAGHRLINGTIALHGISLLKTQNFNDLTMGLFDCPQGSTSVAVASNIVNIIVGMYQPPSLGKFATGQG